MNKEFRFGQEARHQASKEELSNPREQRREAIHKILSGLRKQELVRLTSMVHHESQRQPSAPGDESDSAQMQQELEMHASLLWRSQSRLAVISAALERLEQGGFGYCEECGEEISVERLGAIPMASYCIECQSRSENFRAAEVATTFTSFAFAPPDPRTLEEPTFHDEPGESGAAARLRTLNNRKRRQVSGVRR